jgi:hypothetical protein
LFAAIALFDEDQREYQRFDVTSRNEDGLSFACHDAVPLSRIVATGECRQTLDCLLEFRLRFAEGESYELSTSSAVSREDTRWNGGDIRFFQESIAKGGVIGITECTEVRHDEVRALWRDRGESCVLEAFQEKVAPPGVLCDQLRVP